MRLLVTGGAGYIGSHTCVELLNAGHQIVVVDNLCNSRVKTLEMVAKITETELMMDAPKIEQSAPVFVFAETDIRDHDTILDLLQRHKIESLIHFAGLKAVGESVAKPLLYYDNNIGGTIALCKALRKANIRRVVFSSSATVYGEAKRMPIDETFPLTVTNPYGRSKLFIENIFRDLHRAEPGWRVALLRYFNPVGAHQSGRIGENPKGTPNNLMPYIAQVAAGILPELSVFGDDYETPDGTGVRDYLHVVDLAKGHLAALEFLKREQNDEILTVNLGTGNGHSVLEMVAAFERASGRAIPKKIAPRRAGDAAVCYANPDYAHKILGWRAKLGINEMCADTWRYQQNQISKK